MLRSTLLLFAGIACCGASSASTVINFDDRLGMDPPFVPGRSVGPEFLINNQYAGLGVVFNSGGGGLFLAAASNAVSGPNTVGATDPGPVISYTADVSATFFAGDSLGTTDFVALTLTSSSGDSTLTAFGLDGSTLGTSFGGASGTLSISAAGIHSVVLSGGPFGFDDFTFGNVSPTPGSLALLTFAGLLARRRR